jgi:predicted nucleic acid-binding protein
MRAGKRVSAGERRQALHDFSLIWADTGVSEVDRTLTDTAGDLAERHGLRAYDALHLATALDVASAVNPAFLCFDDDLREAAEREGLRILPAAG